jgi:hypothetical protein
MPAGLGPGCERRALAGNVASGDLGGGAVHLEDHALPARRSAWLLAGGTEAGVRIAVIRRPFSAGSKLDALGGPCVNWGLPHLAVASLSMSGALGFG